MTDLAKPATLTGPQRVTLAAVADALVPRWRHMPSASEIDLIGTPLGCLFVARPDLPAPLAAVLDGIADEEPDRALDRLSRKRRPDFDILV